MTTNKYPFWLAIAATVLLAACQPKAPPADFQYLDGHTGYWQDFQGKWLLINYWADWCKPCIEELPELNAFNDSRDDVQVVGIHFDNPPPDQQKTMAAALNIRFPVMLAQPHRHYQYPLPQVLPATAIITPEGKLATILLGPQTQEKLAEQINRYRQD